MHAYAQDWRDRAARRAVRKCKCALCDQWSLVFTAADRGVGRAPCSSPGFPPAMVRASLFPMSDARSLRGSRCEGRSAKVCPSSDSVHPRANLEVPQRLSGWKYVRVRTAGDGHGIWAEWGCGLRVTSCTVFAVRKAAGGCLLGAAVLDRGRDVLNPRALGMVHGHRSWAAMVSRRIMRMEMDHALCICVTVVSPSYAVCGVRVCVR